MAAKPSNLFRWATNALTTLAPSSGKQDTGWANSERVPARVLNWLLNGQYQWNAYLDDLHNSVGFLNQAYTWTAAHVFSAPNTFNGPSVFGAANSPVLSGAASEITYGTARSHTRRIPLVFTSTQISGDQSWAPAATTYKANNGALGTARFHLNLPHGSILTGVVAGVDATGTGCSMRAKKIAVNPGTGVHTVTQVGFNASDDTTGVGYTALTLGTVNETIDQLCQYVVDFYVTANVGHSVCYIEITYTEARASGHY